MARTERYWRDLEAIFGRARILWGGRWAGSRR